MSIRVGWPATAAPPLIMEPDGVVEVGGADSTHTSTKADSQAARVTNSVGMEVSMVSSGGVACGGVRQSRRTDDLTGRIMCDDVQDSASTLGAGSVEGIPLLLAEQCGED
ncbi:MAG: hypothetical protein JOZ33_14955, partial [Acidobacteriaceae bacterium]|nr:hypothetical protein [Acidobacteriaceae bacterium]